MSELLAGVSGDERVTAELMGVVDDTVFKLRKFAALNRLGMWQLKGMNLATGRLEEAPPDTWAGVVARVAPDAAQVGQVLAVAEVAAAQEGAVAEQRAATLAVSVVCVQWGRVDQGWGRRCGVHGLSMGQRPWGLLVARISKNNVPARWIAATSCMTDSL
jgi:hypothetical protein